MSAFLKIDECGICHRSLPWEWTPVVYLNGKALSGTGVWRSQLIDGRCPACLAALETARREEKRAHVLRQSLVELMGGEKPYREFTFERYIVTSGNHMAYERSKQFDPSTENLYLWGSCGLGKTHLAWAIARRCFEETLSIKVLPAFELSRKVRMKDPEHEQAVLDGFARAEVLVLDDLGAGPITAFTRQILQEILDSRSFNDRAGLVVTSQFSLDELAARFGDDAVPSRLAGMCAIVRTEGPDGRLTLRKSG